MAACAAVGALVALPALRLRGLYLGLATMAFGVFLTDMVLMDVAMPGLGGIEACRTIKTARPETVVVLVSATHPNELPLEVELSLADAVIWKPTLRPALLQELWTSRMRPC